MRSQTYGDKQREAQRRKKQEELLKHSQSDSAPASETSPDAEQAQGKAKAAPGKTTGKKTGRRSR
jgi:hypothetical protein